MLCTHTCWDDFCQLSWALLGPIGTHGLLGIWNGLIQVKEEGWTGFFKGWQGCSEGFPEGEAWGKSLGIALPARGKPCPSQLFYLDLHSIKKKDILVIFQNFSNINVWRSIVVAKGLKYVCRIIIVYKVLLCHWYVPKIQFYLMIFP